MRISTNQIYTSGTSNMLNQQARLLQLNTQLSTGVRVNTPSDDPIASAQIELMNQRSNSVKIYQKNNQDATNALNLQESTMANIISTIQNLQSLQVQSRNSSLSQSDRDAIAAEAQQTLDSLMGFANSTGFNGEYIFSGSKTNIPAISRSGNPSQGYTYTYNGDNKQRAQIISDNLHVTVNDTGNSLFMDIPAGNGSFAIKQTANPNNGAVSISAGVVTNSSAVPQNETYTITTNANNTVSIVDSHGNAVSGSPFNYESGNAITFNGMSITLSGTMANNQTFSLSTGSEQSIFATAQRMINNLKAPRDTPADNALIETENSQISSQLSNALDNISNYRSVLGGKLNQLSSVDTVNTGMDELNQQVITQLKATDYTKVAGDYSLQLMSLQAAQQTFVRIRSLSVFNFMS